MSRRELLLAGAGLVVAAACGSGDGDAPTKSPPGGAAKGRGLNVQVVSYVHVAGMDQRVVLGLINDDATGPVPLDAPASVTIDGQPVDAEVHAGDGTPIPYLLMRHRFDEPGAAIARVRFKGRTGEAAIDVKDPASVKVPFRGRPMVSTPSPTPGNPLGVDPICTRNPACPLHEVSLDAALAQRRPLAVLFSTPALCKSQFCGPVLDNLLSQHEAFADRVTLLHVEIYANREGKELSPTARAYDLPAEPILFLAGADGVVRERIDNAFDRTEARAALERLVS